MATRLVTIKTFQVSPEAEAAKLHLGEHGIPAFLADVETVNMDWLLGNAVGYIKLQVPSDLADAAVALLDQIPKRRSTTEESASNAETNTCLACGANLPLDQHRCPSCGWSYVGEEELN